MTTKKQTPLSENFTLLSRPHNGPGVRVHSEANGGYVHLKCATARNLETSPTWDDPKNADSQHTLRIAIGNDKTVFLLKIDAHQFSEQTLLTNFWVEAGQEIWISTSSVNTHAVFGFTTPRPTSPPYT